MKKSQGVGLFLTLILGPLGLFYSNVAAAIVVLLGTFLFVIIAGADGAVVVGFIAWALSMVLSAVLVDSYNKNVEIKIKTEERRHREMLAALSGKNLENSEVGTRQSQTPDGGDRLEQ